MELTEKRATDIINAFGPDTVLFECFTAEEVVAAALDVKSEAALVRVYLTGESIHWERADDTGLCYREWKRARPAVLRRLAALGIEVK